MIRLKITRPGASEEYSSGRTEVLVGRREGADLRTEERAASRNHCILRVRDGRVEVIDLGSVNGTLVRGKRIDQVALGRGESFRIGSTEFCLEDYAGASGLSLSEPAVAPAVPAPVTATAGKGGAPVARGA
ncbi:MAG: FHA domain-containing protein, partial [Planctomycetes bacterium]|nr:FHA domain-containing protein [Planctomycetota bacterium]